MNKVYLLDTNAIIALLNNNPKIDSALDGATDCRPRIAI